LTTIDNYSNICPYRYRKMRIFDCIQYVSNPDKAIKIITSLQ